MLTEYIISETEKIIRKYGTRDPFTICASAGIRIRKMDLKQKIKGFYFYQSRIETIAVDESLSDPFCRILIAHELGHAYLHRKIAMMKGFAEAEFPFSYEKMDSCERDANLFAAELLLDDAEVISCLAIHTFFETAAELNVPAALLDYKFYIMQKKGFRLSDMSLARPDFLRKE